MSMNIVGTLAAISLAAIFFTVPLFVKYHVYKPNIRHVIQGDIIKLERHISPIWCQGVHLSSETNFEAFVYDTDPVVDEDDRVRTLFTHQTVLPNKAQEYWGFHLLKGTKVELSTCARLLGGGVTVVKGRQALEKCLEEHRRIETGGETSGENSLSQSESDEDTSSISSSQGAITNDSEIPYVCRNNFQSMELPASYKCRHLSQDSQILYTLSVDVEETDYYYFIFSSKTYLEIIPNEIHAEFSIDRTHYNYASSSSNCSNSSHCTVNFTLMGQHQIVVQTQIINSTKLKSEDLHIVCAPREWIFFMFYAAFLLVIFICAFQ